ALYRHHWQPGDIVIWDNRCTLHRADHSQVVGDRILHRGLISGEAPIPHCI
ncbi:MAG: TauD/TfdA family dioxygenase, partial [Cyanobacteria bacterium J06634_6]